MYRNRSREHLLFQCIKLHFLSCFLLYSRNVNVESVFKFIYDYTNKKVHIVQEHANSLIVVAFLGCAVAISAWLHQGLNAFKIVTMNAKNYPKI